METNSGSLLLRLSRIYEAESFVNLQKFWPPDFKSDTPALDWLTLPS